MFWLRGRILRNQIANASKANRILTIAMLVVGGLASITMFFLALFASSLLQQLTTTFLMFVWLVAVLVFLLTWSTGVLTELQRSEPLALDRFLHLPVSPMNAFLVNFASSFFSISIFMIFPALLGLAIAQVRIYGWHMMFGVLMLFAFLFFIVAVTYQFRGWLASLMVNKRNKRRIVMALTLLMVVGCQLPAILNMTVLGTIRERLQTFEIEKSRRQAQLYTLREEEKITPEQYQLRSNQLDEDLAAEKQLAYTRFADKLRWPLIFIPIGWLALGMEGLVNGTWWIPLLCFGGLIGLSWLSLRRSYQTTLRLYRGEIDSTSSDSSQAYASKDTTAEANQESKQLWGSRLLARDFRFFNQQQAAVAASGFINAARAPEVKMALLTPIAIVIFLAVSLTFRSESSMPLQLRSFTGIAVATFAMFGVMQLVNNQFGYDRDGFRALMLSPIPRRDILIGKNMGLAPYAIAVGLLAVVVQQFVYPMQWTHFLATLVQVFSIYFVICMVANLMSIYAPVAVAQGTMKPVNLKIGVILLQLLITFLLPLLMLPLMVPPGLEILAAALGFDRIPIYLTLSFLMLGIVLLAYRWVIAGQGKMLSEKEKEILVTVTQIG